MYPTLFEIPIPWTDITLPIRGYGLMLMIGFLGATWWAARRAVRVKADPDFIINLGFVALISSIVGARIFYVAHYWDDHFAGRGIWPIINVSAGGLEFYGGFIGAVVAGIAYMWFAKKSIRLYLDIVAPSIMFGMSMARIGCFLNGCCWGGYADASLPWAVQFPYASPAFYRQFDERMKAVPAELMFIDADGVPMPIQRDLINLPPEKRDGPMMKVRQLAQARQEAEARGDEEAVRQLNENLKAAKEAEADHTRELAYITQPATRFNLTPTEIADRATSHRTLHLHPAQLYASIDGILLAILLNIYFYRRKRHGMVFTILLLTYPFVRIVEETIRIDNPHDTAGLTISQFVSVVLVLIGVAFFIKLRRLPLRSKAADLELQRRARPAQR